MNLCRVALVPRLLGSTAVESENTPTNTSTNEDSQVRASGETTELKLRIVSFFFTVIKYM